MDFYAFCICISGYIDLEIDNKKFTVSQNGFLVSAPSTVVRFLSQFQKPQNGFLVLL